jgi:hypothetical protein
MLTLIETISLAGDRAKQNDDALGGVGDCAWVIDGATDLHNTPVAGRASDAAWLAGLLNDCLVEQLSQFADVGAPLNVLRAAIDASSTSARELWDQYDDAASAERWKLPTASVLILSEHNGAIAGIDLGDCRCVALDADGAAHIVGGPSGGVHDEVKAAARAGKSADPAALLRDANTLDLLRGKRAEHNLDSSYWVFGLQSECAVRARQWSLTLARPAHILLMTDGFSALVDRYNAYDPGGLVRAALEKGLHELGRELRAIETADAGGAKHPRFKPSDDATAVLLRLS